MGSKEQQLEQQNYLLSQELEDLQVRYRNLQKEHQVWDNINSANDPPKSHQEEQSEFYKSQLLNLAEQKRHLEFMLKQSEDRVEDLRERNCELKDLSRKQTELHQKQIQYLRRELGSAHNEAQSPRPSKRQELTESSLEGARRQSQNSEVSVQQLREQVRFLQEQLTVEKSRNSKSQIKLEKCSEIAKQMEEFYNSELESKDDLICELEAELSSFKRCGGNDSYTHWTSPSNERSIAKASSKKKDILSEEENSLYCSSIVADCHRESIEAIEEKYEKRIRQLEALSQKEIHKYQDKVKYLILRVEALEVELHRAEAEKGSAFEDKVLQERHSANCSPQGSAYDRHLASSCVKNPTQRGSGSRNHRKFDAF